MFVIGEGQRAGVQGTPSFFLALTEPNDGMVKAVMTIRGAQPYAAFKQAIESHLSAQKQYSQFSGERSPWSQLILLALFLDGNQGTHGAMVRVKILFGYLQDVIRSNVPYPRQIAIHELPLG